MNVKNESNILRPITSKDFDIHKIKPSILGGLHCNDFLILDGKNDTLIYVEKFKMKIVLILSKFNFVNRKSLNSKESFKNIKIMKI